jgi:hypothetical protein
MMSRKKTAAVMIVAVLGVLAACGEREQAMGNSKRRDVQPEWKSSRSTTIAPGYTPGDKEAWEAQLRQRAQFQNDYSASLK